MKTKINSKKFKSKTLENIGIRNKRNAFVKQNRLQATLVNVKTSYRSCKGIFYSNLKGFDQSSTFVVSIAKNNTINFQKKLKASNKQKVKKNDCEK